MKVSIKTTVINILSWTLSCIGILLGVILSLANLIGGILIIVSSLIIFPPIRPVIRKYINIRYRYYFIISTILFIYGFIYTGSNIHITDSQLAESISRKVPTTTLAVSPVPSVYLSYDCGTYAEEISINEKSLNREDIDRLCKTRYPIVLNDGENIYKLVFTFKDSSYSEIVKIKFSKEEYDTKVAELQKEKDANEKRLQEEKALAEKQRLEEEALAEKAKQDQLVAEQKAATEARKALEKKLRVEFTGLIIEIDNYNKTVASLMTKIQNAPSDYEGYKYAKQVKDLGQSCSIERYELSEKNYSKGIQNDISDLYSSMSQYCLDIYGWGNRVMRYLDGKDNSYKDLELIEEYTNSILQGAYTVSAQSLIIGIDLGIDVESVIK